MKWISFLFMVFTLFSCLQKDKVIITGSNTLIPIKPTSFNRKISEIPPPDGFYRMESDSGSFVRWLRNLPLKKDRTVYLFNGKPKQNQSAQFAVLDISTGNNDLQQCADVVIRLRAEYLFANQRFSEISFTDFGGKEYKWMGGSNREEFEKYLDYVFGWCGSASLEKQLKPVTSIKKLKAGDVFIKGGFPGHAMLVADVALNNKRETVFLLVQGYTPAQDMHLVVNPLNKRFSPWYEVNDSGFLYTPEWTFRPDELRSW